MRIKRKIIFNSRNNQASVTIPSKLLKKLQKTPTKVFIEIDDALLRRKVSKPKGG
jgi:hypothetical protein